MPAPRANFAVAVPNPCASARSGVHTWFLALVFALGGFATGNACSAQTSVVTQQYDISRIGANTNESVLTPSNVNSSSFGKLFHYPVDGYVYAQPLIVPGVVIGTGTRQAGTTHNVVFVATEHDSVYAFDADNNSGANAFPLWQVSMLDSAHGAAPGATTITHNLFPQRDIVPEIGITGTPVIDTGSRTLYVVSKTFENNNYVQRLHALDITTGNEKFGGPVVLSASVRGNGVASSGGVLHFDPKMQNQRSGLLLLNGIVYISFGAHQDISPWHGWILAYDAITLHQTGVWCSTPNGSSGGVWMAGEGLAADLPTGKPYGRLFIATGNGSYNAVAPDYDSTMNYGDSILRMDLTNGVPSMTLNGQTVGDEFTANNQSLLDTSDKDQGSGGVLLLPDSVGGGKQWLIQGGKLGQLYQIDRNSMGGYHPNDGTDPQAKATVGGLWSSPAYWNGYVYVWGSRDQLKAFSFSDGAISPTPTSAGSETTAFPGSTPAVSANGDNNGIVWNLLTAEFTSQGPEVLYAHDALNVFKTLYTSAQNSSRDYAGAAVKFAVPTVFQGRVYVGAEDRLTVYGLLNAAAQAAAPVLSPSGRSFQGSLQIQMSDSSSNTAIYYTKDGSAPSTSSTVYGGPVTIKATTTIKAAAAGPGWVQSATTTETYTVMTATAMPVFSPAPGTYSSTQSVTISEATSGATIYYTTDGSAPTTSSAKYAGPITISSSLTLNAIAVSPGMSASPVVSGTYTIHSPAAVVSPTSMTFPATLEGATGPAQNISVKNNGTAPLLVKSVSVGGANASDFSVANGCAAAIPPSGNCTIAVTFAPSGFGQRTTTLTIADDAPNSPQTVSLNGTGVAAASAVVVSPTTVDFPATVEGAARPGQNISVENSGTVALHVRSASLGGANPSDFSVANGCTAAIPPLSSCSISVTFAPLVLGQRSATLTISDDAPDSPQTVTLGGTGNIPAVISAAPNGSLSASASAGATATYNLQVTPDPNFTGTVTFSCTGTPASASCQTPTVNVRGSAPVPFQVTVLTSRSAVALPPSTIPRRFPTNSYLRPPELTKICLWFALATLLMWASCGVHDKAARARVQRTLAFASVLLLVRMLAGCANVNAPPETQKVVPSSVTYVLTLTATATNTLQKQIPLPPVQLTLTVN